MEKQNIKQSGFSSSNNNESSGSTATASAKEFSASGGSAASSAAKKVGDTIERVGEKVRKTGDVIEHLGDNSEKDWIGPITERVAEFEKNAKDFIRARPLTIIGGALAAGYIANRLLFSNAKPSKNQAQGGTQP